MQFISTVINNFFTQPAFFIGTITLVGLAVMGKKWYECLSGFIKTAVGFFIMNIGSSGFQTVFKPLVTALGAKFNLTAAVADTYLMKAQATSQTDGLYSLGGGAGLYWAMFAYLVSVATNFILVKFQKLTKCRTLYVTGHTLQNYTLVWMWFVMLVCPAAQNMTFALLFGVLGGTWAAVGSNITFEATQKVTNNAGFAIAHQEMFGLWYIERLGHLLNKDGKKEVKSIGDLEMPGWLSIFSDNIVATAVISTIFFGGLICVLGRETIAEYDSALKASQVLLVYILDRCFHFAVYMYILLAGVRMFISELMKAFDGFQKKLLKGSIVAVDVAVSYNYVSASTPLVGFVCGLLGQVVAIVGLLVFKSPVFVIPGFVPLFFDNASLAVYADKLIGGKGAVIIPFLNGIVQIVLTMVMVLIVKGMSGVDLSAWGAFTDNNIVLALIGLVHYLINPYAAVILCIVALLGFNLWHYNMHKEHYYDYLGGK